MWDHSFRNYSVRCSIDFLLTAAAGYRALCRRQLMLCCCGSWSLFRKAVARLERFFPHCESSAVPSRGVGHKTCQRPCTCGSHIVLLPRSSFNLNGESCVHPTRGLTILDLGGSSHEPWHRLLANTIHTLTSFPQAVISTLTEVNS